MYKSVVYKGEELLGEVEIYAQEQQQEEEENKNKRKRVIDEIVKGIRISHFSQASERCPPLAVLHTITSIGVCFKMEESTSSSTTKISQQESPLHLLHSSCIQENKVQPVNDNNNNELNNQFKENPLKDLIEIGG
jgi:RNA polymerase II C-terminal domain phosphatase-like 1/2